METRQHFNEQPGVSGEMSVRFDLATGRVESFGVGFWSVRQANAFFADWRGVVHQIHANGQSLCALVNLGEGQVQSADVVEVIAHGTRGMYRAGDAIAMLVPSSLAKMQMRRVLDGRYHEFFISRGAAETWLRARCGERRLAG